MERRNVVPSDACTRNVLADNRIDIPQKAPSFWKQLACPMIVYDNLISRLEVLERPHSDTRGLVQKTFSVRASDIEWERPMCVLSS